MKKAQIGIGVFLNDSLKNDRFFFLVPRVEPGNEVKMTISMR